MRRIDAFLKGEGVGFTHHVVELLHLGVNGQLFAHGHDFLVASCERLFRERIRVAIL